MAVLDTSADDTNTLSCYMRRGLPPRTSLGTSEFKPILDPQVLAKLLSAGAYCSCAIFDHAVNYCLSGPELVEYLKYPRFFSFDPSDPRYPMMTIIMADHDKKSTHLVETLLADGRFPVGEWMGYACELPSVQVEMLELLHRHGGNARGVEIDPDRWRSHGDVVQSWLTAHGAVARLPPV
jgi:hypothetical protein